MQKTQKYICRRSLVFTEKPTSCLADRLAECWTQDLIIGWAGKTNSWASTDRSEHRTIASNASVGR